MKVINTLIEKSFLYTNEKENLAMRRDEIGELMEIVAYCQDESVKEALLYQDALWETQVQEGITFTEWLYCGGGAGNEEDRRRLQEVLSKKGMIPSDSKLPVNENSSMKSINIALGEFQSCFINSCFATNVLSEMKHIDNFPDRTKEITKALGILNDKAVGLYQQYSDHLEEAIRILSILLRRGCAPDPAHAEDLIFSFTYSEQLEGKTVARTKDIECSPHLKLIHPGSNLRIYFYWCDDTIGAGEKVLVGRIGRHPY